MGRYSGSAIHCLKVKAQAYRAIALAPRCPLLSKWLLVAAVAYALSPLDLIPDFIPVIGQIDDLVIVSLLIGLALKSIPGELLEEYGLMAQGRTGGKK